MSTAAKQGNIAQIFGPVVDVRFPAGALPPIYNALEIVDPKRTGRLVLEVAQHLGNDVARCVAMSSTGGISDSAGGVSNGGSNQPNNRSPAKNPPT